MSITRKDALKALMVARAAGLRGGPPVDLTSETADAWVAVLTTFDGPRLMRAVHAHMLDPDRGSWWPTPADLFAADPESRAARFDDWSDVYGQINDRIGRVGVWCLKDVGLPPEVYNHAERAIAACGGWDAFGLSEPGDRTMRACFRDAYKSSKERALIELSGVPICEWQAKMLEEPN